MIYTFIIGCYVGLVLYNFFHKKFRIAEYEDGLYWIESNMILVPFAWSNKNDPFVNGDIIRGNNHKYALDGFEELSHAQDRLNQYYEYKKSKRSSTKRKRVVNPNRSKTFDHKRAREINEELETATGKKFDRLIKELNELTR